MKTNSYPVIKDHFTRCAQFSSWAKKANKPAGYEGLSHLT